MFLIIALLPILIFLVSALILGNSGRDLKEKITIFFLTPDNIDRDSYNLISILRFCFWVSLIVSVWMIIKICKGRGTF